MAQLVGTSQAIVVLPGSVGRCGDGGSSGGDSGNGGGGGGGGGGSGDCSFVFDDFHRAVNVSGAWGTPSSNPGFDWFDNSSASFGTSGGFGYADLTGSDFLDEIYQDAGNTTLPWSHEFTVQIDFIHDGIDAESFVEYFLAVIENTTGETVNAFVYLTTITGDQSTISTRGQLGGPPIFFADANIAVNPGPGVTSHLKWHFLPGGTSQIKFWADPDPEPDWMATADATGTTSSGDKRLRVNSDSDYAVHIDFDNLVFCGGGGGDSPPGAIGGGGTGGGNSGVIEVTTDNVVIDGLTFTGTESNGPVGSRTIFITTPNATAANPIRNLTIRNCIFDGGTIAIWLTHVQGFTIYNNTIRNFDYAGIDGWSVLDGTITNNVVENIGSRRTDFSDPAFLNNAYGIILNRNESNSLILDPMSARVLVDHNTVDNVPIWMCINSHGGVDLTFTWNHTSRSPRGMFHAGSPGGGNPVRIIVDHNTVLQCVTKAGGSQDKSAISPIAWNGTSVQFNTVSTTFDTIINNYQNQTVNTIIGGQILVP